MNTKRIMMGLWILLAAISLACDGGSLPDSSAAKSSGKTEDEKKKKKSNPTDLDPTNSDDGDDPNPPTKNPDPPSEPNDPGSGTGGGSNPPAQGA